MSGVKRPRAVPSARAGESAAGVEDRAAKRARLDAAVATDVSSGAHTPVVAVDHPFPTDPLDHAETPLRAYADVAPLLHLVAGKLGKSASALRIYDPYYCAGSMRAHLASLGFTSVYNACEDFYARLASGTVPEFDVLVTNPPFSGDHIERLLAFCCGIPQPWLILMPQYIFNKPFFWRLVRSPSAASAAAAGDGADDGDDDDEEGSDDGDAAIDAGSGSTGAEGDDAASRQLMLYVGPGPAQAPYAFAAPVATSAGAALVADAAERHRRLPASPAPTAAAPVASGGRGAAAAVAASRASAGSSPARAAGPAALAAGKFQCVWFCNMRAFAKEAVDGWPTESEAAAASSSSATAAVAASASTSGPLDALPRPGSIGTSASDGSPDTLLSPTGAALARDTPLLLPQLAVAGKLTPAERRWRKKHRRLSGQIADV